MAANSKVVQPAPVPSLPHSDKDPDFMQLNKALRACFLCRLIKSEAQFIDEGCDNCEEIIGIAEERGRVDDFTTANFSGMVTVMDPSTSWVTKWMHQRTKVPGCYCLVINADPTDAVMEVVAEKGIKLKTSAYE